MKILAYADRISLRPGESIQFKVSCDDVPRYDATLVRVIQGDTNSEGPGYREETLSVDLGGPFDGQFQALKTGSYALIDDHPALERLSTFSIVVALWPTTPGQRAQTIIARRNPPPSAGFELCLNEQGAPELELTASDQTAISVSTNTPLLERRWYLLCASYDAAAGTLAVSQNPLDFSAPEQGGGGTCDAPANIVQAATSTPLMFAARPGTGETTERHFNGRIGNPRLYSAVLDSEQALLAIHPRADTVRPTQLVAAWDFSIGIPTDRITDISANQLHGRLVNLPTRGVTSHQWCAQSFDWTHNPEHYAAIHFHDDDIYDANWETSFAFDPPSHLHSGLYAVMLSSQDAEYYVPFCILPPRGKPTERVAFLLPTASYMAYANNRIGIDVPETELVTGRLLELTEQDRFMQTHPELGLCFYDLHNDGSGVFYSSRLRPIVDMQPKFVGKLGGFGSNLWQFNADTHILGWLESIEQPFDVITDEDLHDEGLSLLQGYQVVLTGSHPEYHSAAMLDALQAYTERGGRLMYLGGNGFYWRISYHPELPGVIECRKSEVGIRAFPPGPGEFFASFTGEYTGLWRRNGRAPNRLVGVGMVSQGFDVSFPYRRTEASRDERAAFIFAGVDEEIIGDFGLGGGAAAGMEVDAVN
ncbi:MAG: N,N-dimethylformamidase beta subunit family domain-containing protein, partial [Gammaproteobacteria bacterium]